MHLNKHKMLEIVRHQLAIDMNCNDQDFIEDGIVFCEASMNENRRLFERQSPYLEIATMGKGVVISADANVLKKVKPLLENKSREDIFVVPFIYGYSLYYIPDSGTVKQLPYPNGLTIHVKEGKEIHELYNIEGFENAIQYDPNHIRPDILVIYVKNGDKIIGMAGASVDSNTMWQIGIDVLEDYRNKGIAKSLVSNLAIMIMERGIVPYYDGIIKHTILSCSK